MSDPRHVSTARLDLRAVTSGDVDVVHTLNADPRVWTHLPSGVHTSRDQTAAQVARLITAWERDRLGYWTARTHDATFVGIGGCTVKDDVAWNLYYRFMPHAQGKGLASELAAAALSAAQSVRPELPVVALLLEHNGASKAVAERVGLNLVWRGPDQGNPDPDAIRLIYADRKIDSASLDRLHA